MARVSSADLLSYAQEYIRAVFSDVLLQEEFISPDGKNTIWYRVVNKEVVNTICFYTRSLSQPIMLEMGYGIHPLFVEPFRTAKVYLNDFPFNFEVLHAQRIVSRDGQCGGRYYSSNIPIMIPHGKDRGLYTLEGIALPKMNSVKTALDCYELHKLRYQENKPTDKKFNITFEQRLSTCSTDFINEGIFFEDEALYPIFRNLVTERIQNAESYDEKMRRSKWGKTRLHHLEYQKKALFEDNRGDFLDSMEQQKANVIDLLERKYLLPF